MPGSAFSDGRFGDIWNCAHSLQPIMERQQRAPVQQIVQRVRLVGEGRNGKHPHEPRQIVGH